MLLRSGASDCFALYSHLPRLCENSCTNNYRLNVSECAFSFKKKLLCSVCWGSHWGRSQKSPDEDGKEHQTCPIHINQSKHNQQPDPGRHATSFLWIHSTIGKKRQYQRSDSGDAITQKCKKQKDAVAPLGDYVLPAAKRRSSVKWEGEWNSCTLPTTGGALESKRDIDDMNRVWKALGRKVIKHQNSFPHSGKKDRKKYPGNRLKIPIE